MVRRKAGRSVRRPPSGVFRLSSAEHATAALAEVSSAHAP